MTYLQALEYLESFINYEKIAGPYDQRSWKLERMERLLGSVDNPHIRIPFIHIAGTKGKGSTAAMIESVLRTGGCRVGLYTSPHLVSFRERIRVDGRKIGEDEVGRLVARLKPHVEKLRFLDDGLGLFSFFDLYTTLAFMYFEMREVDFAVLEVGLGGRLDATNVVNPLVSVITQISYDHLKSLGNTLTEIAREKAGIIKEQGSVIVSPQADEAMRVIHDTVREKEARLCVAGQEITWRKTGGRSFRIKGIHGEYSDLRIPLLGDHQIINAATAVGALELLRDHGFSISPDVIRRGLASVRWPARCEVIGKDPAVILDAAHNEASAKALADVIESEFSGRKLVLVIATLAQKDIRGMARHLCPLADKVILTRADNPRAMDLSEAEEGVTEFCRDAILIPGVPSAMEKARELAGTDGVICITGAVCLAGEVMQTMGREVP